MLVAVFVKRNNMRRRSIYVTATAKAEHCPLFVAAAPTHPATGHRSTQASSLELVFDTMTCLFQHLGSRAVPMLPFLGSVLHMLTYSLPAILGPVGAAEESPLDTDDEGSEKDGGGLSGAAGAEPKSGAQATATYYAAVQVCCGGGRRPAWQTANKPIKGRRNVCMYIRMHMLYC